MDLCSGVRKDPPNSNGQPAAASSGSSFFDGISFDWCTQRSGKKPANTSEPESTTNNIYSTFSWPEWAPDWISKKDQPPAEAQPAANNNNNNMNNNNNNNTNINNNNPNNNKSNIQNNPAAPNPPPLPFGTSTPTTGAPGFNPSQQQQQGGFNPSQQPPPQGQQQGGFNPQQGFNPSPRPAQQGGQQRPAPASMPAPPPAPPAKEEPITLKCTDAKTKKPATVAITTNTTFADLRKTFDKNFGPRKTFRYDSGARNVTVEVAADFEAFINFLKRNRTGNSPLSMDVEVVDLPERAWMNT